MEDQDQYLTSATETPNASQSKPSTPTITTTGRMTTNDSYTTPLEC
jgi:hypothetical protein